MTVTTPLSAELADTPCSVAECWVTAAHLGRASIRIDPTIGAAPDFEIVTLGLPLCTNHAHLLRNGCSLRELSSGV